MTNNNVIELFKKEKDSKSFYNRLESCLKFEQDTGEACVCNYCTTKDRLSDELLNLAVDKIQLHNKYTKDKLSHGDLLEILFLSTVKFKNKLKVKE